MKKISEKMTRDVMTRGVSTVHADTSVAEIVNILTNHAVNNGRITVFGGEQKRPNLHIEDMTDLYVRLLESPDEIARDTTSRILS